MKQYPFLRQKSEKKEGGEHHHQQEGTTSLSNLVPNLPAEASSPPVNNPLPFDRRRLQQGQRIPQQAAAGASSSVASNAASTAIANMINSMTEEQKAEIRQMVYDTTVSMLK